MVPVFIIVPAAVMGAQLVGGSIAAVLIIREQRKRRKERRERVRKFQTQMHADEEARQRAQGAGQVR